MIAKRAFDLVVAVTVLVLAAPVMLAIGAAIWATMGRPIFFVQQRAGLHGRPFHLIKFRTMRAAFDPEGRPLPDAERLTRMGRLLRATSMDELPGLWNVVRGDMSLVGPRPLLMDYLPLYSPEQARRHEVRPGITGWVQVNGRNALTWEEKFRLDVWYVDNQSLWLDLRILAVTAIAVLRRRGIDHTPDRPMPRFTGNTEQGAPASQRTDRCTS